MRHFLYTLNLFLIFSFSLSIAYAEKLKIEPLRFPVEDRAQMFSSNVDQWANQELSRLYKEGGPQIQILTLPSIGETAIEEVAIQVMDQEKLGRKGKDDGILFILSKAEHKMRIEVGRGLEGELPDVNAKRILDDYVKPYFKKGQMDRGLIEGLLKITGEVAPKFAFTGMQQQSMGREHHNDGNIFDDHPFLVLILIIFFIFFFRGGGPFIFGGGSFGGGGGGRDGWSGGGGGSAGGGASSDW